MNDTEPSSFSEPRGFAEGSRAAPDPSLITYTHIIYALHALSVLVGITGTVTIVGSFVFGIPSILAVVMNYARQPEVEGTWLEGHFRWQIRTFWYALLWMIVAALFSAPLLLLLGLGVFTFYGAAAVVGAWVIYRVLRGWFALRGSRPPRG